MTCRTLPAVLHVAAIGHFRPRPLLEPAIQSPRYRRIVPGCTEIAEFERARLRERVLAGLARARREGRRLGRPPRHVTARDLAQVAGLSVPAAARELNVSPSVLQRARHDAAGEAQHGCEGRVVSRFD